MLADLTKRKGYLFDLDGTVINSEKGIFNALFYTFEKLSIKINSINELYKFIGPSIGSTFQKEYGMTKEEAARAVTIYREYYSRQGLYECSAYEGIENLFKILKFQGKLIALATKKPIFFSEEILKNLNIFSYFDAISGASGDEDDDSKSAIIEHAIKLLGFEKSECVMIGDTKYDAIGATQAGVDCVGVLYGFGTQTELSVNGIDCIAKDIPTLTDILTKQA